MNILRSKNLIILSLILLTFNLLAFKTASARRVKDSSIERAEMFDDLLQTISMPSSDANIEALESLFAHADLSVSEIEYIWRNGVSYPMRDSLKQLVDTGFLRDKNFPEFISILNSWLENNYSYDGFKIYDSVFNRALTDALFHISGFPGTKYRRVTPKNFLAILNECAKAKKQDAWSAMLFYLDIHEILTTERLGKLLELTNSYYDHPYWASPVKEILELSGHFDAAPKSSKIALMDALIDWHLDFASENTAEDRIAVKGITSKLLKDLKSLELDTLYYADPYLVAAAFLNQGIWPYLGNNNHITHWPFARITSLGNRKIQDLSLKELEKLIITIRLSHQESSDSETTW